MNLEPLQRNLQINTNSRGGPYDFWGLAVVQMDGQIDGWLYDYHNLLDA